MKDRILDFLKKENKTAVHFAEEIGVQPSGISHILSGRNKPSLDFILKMLERYSFISPEWLLFGRGSMYRDSVNPTLFDNPGVDFSVIEPPQDERSGGNQKGTGKYEPVNGNGFQPPPTHMNRPVKKIVWFYADNTFEEFSPGNSRPE